MKKLCIFSVLCLLPTLAFSQLEWRVSVKFIVDGNGDRPSNGYLRTDADVQSDFAFANKILDRLGRGYRFRITEIADLTNAQAVTNFFNVDSSDLFNATSLAYGAANYKTLFLYRDDAINIYINGFQGTAVTSISQSGPATNDIILAGQTSITSTLFHETGHFFNLYHTQGQACGNCVGPNGCTVPGDDEIPDTLPDLACWGQDDIATNAFGVLYANLATAQQAQVDLTHNNLGSQMRQTESEFRPRAGEHGSYPPQGMIPPAPAPAARLTAPSPRESFRLIRVISCCCAAGVTTNHKRSPNPSPCALQEVKLRSAGIESS
jgi:hypothetical protein